MTRNYAVPLDAVDRVELTTAGATVTKRIVADDPYIEGHYPGFPIYPGVFTVETVYQASRGLVESRREPGTRVTLAEVRSVRFKAPLRPGDELTAECELRDDPDDISRVLVVAECRRKDGATVAKVTLDLRVHEAGDHA
ncbi:3-hydroxyacyl-ACP dehydratase FabZ family protein [Actinoplanes sp. NEAU-A12]|uniref:3-hydroxyacyl-ACP dehydratase FabZ family protein n=1 Tax=Actinoplanes sandaracinus TaxID=3045177 RepID=A0ABT6WHQ7_9ACTN|nr:3-hydroxyacyl-ACP dehydratase FabZ family protein [Actinoplanes sandaracinus]MDI6099250.1 3-hydroxyacyl-ACP dehydratase FabZ family protein [Actinoplanes sandaracinus]